MDREKRQTELAEYERLFEKLKHDYAGASPEEKPELIKILADVTTRMLSLVHTERKPQD